MLAAMDGDSSDLSSLSSLSPVASDEEPEVEVERQPGGILKFFHPIKKDDKISPPAPKIKVKTASNTPSKEASPPEPAMPVRRERQPSPPHELSFSDNPDIAVCSPSLVASSKVGKTAAVGASWPASNCLYGA